MPFSPASSLYLCIHICLPICMLQTLWLQCLWYLLAFSQHEAYWTHLEIIYPDQPGASLWPHLRKYQNLALCFFLAQLFYPADYCLTYSLTKWKTSNKQTANPYDPNLFLRGQSSLLTGSSLHKKPLYITHGIIVMSPYYVVYTYLRQSMWMHCDALYSPWLSFWKPISWYMLSPWVAALASTNGLTRDKQWDKWAFNSSFVPPWM